MLSFKLTLVKVLKGWDGLFKISTFSQKDDGADWDYNSW